MPSIGLVVESEYDIEALSPLIAGFNAPGVQIFPQLCRGGVGGRSSRRLRDLQYAARIDKAVVVSDADGRDPETLARKLEREVEHLGLPFPVTAVVLVQEMEALLLADPRAIESVCLKRGRPITLPNLRESPERLADPKSELETFLSSGGIRYTKVVAREIATAAAAESLEYWSRSFRRLRVAATLTDTNPNLVT